MNLLHLISLIACAAIVASKECPRRVCYYTNWSQYRPGQGKFWPENINVTMCTHLYFAFAKLQGNSLAPFEWNDLSTKWRKGLYQHVNDLKQQNANLTTLLAVGGWTLGSEPFSAMVATATGRQEFANTSVTYLRLHGFDGLSLDWQYPTARGSPPEDRERFALLVEELKSTFELEAQATGRARLLLTAGVPAGKDIIDAGYDVPNITGSVDFLNLMALDYHGPWESVTGENSPLYPSSLESGSQLFLNVNWSVNYWLDKGTPPDKLVVAIPAYGRSFTLNSTQHTFIGAPANSSGLAGSFTQERGILAYYEICARVPTADVLIKDTEQGVPYLVNNDQWVGFDDQNSVRKKVQYIKNLNLGGVMFWTLDFDDFTGTFCGQGRYPLLSAIYEECRIP